ncbi:MAG: uL14 family ribosomal protein, partial [Halobacteriaceae archaeon]
MKAVKSDVTRALPVGSVVGTCDNSGAQRVKIISVKEQQTVKGQNASAGVGDMVMVSVVKGKPDMRRRVVPAVVVRQKKAFKRPDGSRISFPNNAVAICKDEDGNPFTDLDQLTDA